MRTGTLLEIGVKRIQGGFELRFNVLAIDL
jgi:hypothetical protein